MATATYIGAQQSRAQSGTLTIGTASTGGTITFTIGGTAAIVITPTTNNTTTTAAELLAAIQAAAALNPVVAEITFAQATNVITFVGPADGAPLTLSKTDGGSNATTLAATGIAAPLSPYDASDVANYSGGALPNASDTLVCELAGAAIKYNLTALNANALANFIREATFGQIGLPDVNPAGYREFRTTHLELNSALATIETSSADAAQSVRLNLVTTACTLTILGDQGGGQIGAEAITLKGSATATAVNATGGSLAVAVNAGDTVTVTTLRGANSTVHVGPGCTLGTPNFYNCTAKVEASWSSTMVIDGGGTIEVTRAATGTLTIDSGTVLWKSTVAPGNSPAIGSGATLDLSQAPAGFTVGGTILGYAGGTLNDVIGRGGNYAIQLVRCTVSEFNWITPNSKTFTLS